MAEDKLGSLVTDLEAGDDGNKTIDPLNDTQMSASSQRKPSVDPLGSPKPKEEKLKQIKNKAKSGSSSGLLLESGQLSSRREQTEDEKKLEEEILPEIIKRLDEILKKKPRSANEEKQL